MAEKPEELVEELVAESKKGKKIKKSLKVKEEEAFKELKGKEEASIKEVEEDDESEESDDFIEGETYDLDKGDIVSDFRKNDFDNFPWKSKIKSAKEFFNTEILYRHDILLQSERDRISGDYRIELKGYQGGIWSFSVGEDVKVVNRKLDAEVVLSMQQSDFLNIVNGELNPQIALLSRKIKVTGDIKKAIALQSLFAPSVD